MELALLQLMVVTCPQFQLIDDLKEANASNLELLAIHQQIENPILDSPSCYTFIDRLLYFKHHLVVPSSFDLKEKLFLDYHSTPIGRHVGVHHTFHHVANNFYWKRMCIGV